MSVVFAFVYGVHDFFGTAHKTLSTTLQTQHTSQGEGCVQEHPRQDGLTERRLLAEETVTHKQTNSHGAGIQEEPES